MIRSAFRTTTRLLGAQPYARREILTPGDGEKPQKGDIAFIKTKMFVNGESMFSGYRGAGVEKRVPVGAEANLELLDMYLEDMKVGETSRLEASHHYAFGDAGVAPRIPPEAEIVVEVSLLGVE
eukprot:TRINITY_DN7491_c0_g1_i1.p1 TRINITY_DN7491_c0_g1~~TRINITY_DN7491_c0_g1_i1.p1  ORF type:complete len:137 (+),score=22.66 TRINITY_DN7491_c0_g1_i1:42-413(+)